MDREERWKWVRKVDTHQGLVHREERSGDPSCRCQKYSSVGAEYLTLKLPGLETGGLGGPPEPRNFCARCACPTGPILQVLADTLTVLTAWEPGRFTAVEGLGSVFLYQPDFSFTFHVFPFVSHLLWNVWNLISGQ